MAGGVREHQERRARSRTWRGWITGLVIGILGALALVVLIGMPLAIGHRHDLPLERIYGGAAVNLALRTQAGSKHNPLPQNAQTLETGRNAYTGSCAICHGATGDGKGVFGDALYPPATNLREHDTQEKNDAQMFWILKNGLSFAGMPAFGARYDDRTLWALVSYVRTLGGGQTTALAIPTPTTEQLAQANPGGDAAQRGAAVYFAQGCDTCHGATGNAPGQLGLRAGEREADRAIRQGTRGMPSYGPEQITDSQLSDLEAYLATFSGGRRR